MKIKAICVFTIAAIAVSGCAAPGNQPTNAQSGATTGAVVGGAGSFLVCRLTGRSTKDCLAVAALGAVVGGSIGWQKGKEKDLAEVKIMTSSLQKAGMPASIDTANVQGKDEQGKAVTVEAFKGITIPLDPVAPEIKSNNPNVVKAMQDLGVLSVTRNEPTRIIYRVGPSTGGKVRDWINQGIAQGKQANTKAVDPILQELPYVAGKPEFVRVEAKDQAQFAMTSPVQLAKR